MIKLSALIVSVLVGTWNGDWFPSGRAEHRAHPEVEEATISAAAKMLASGIRSADPQGTNDVILILNEIRGYKVATNLVSRMGRADLKVASVSWYRRRDRFDQQQDVIVTTLPVANRGWSVWKNHKNETPPRGYAFADIVIEPTVTAKVYAVHLKSNYGAKTDEKRALNRVKRTHSVEQLLSQSRNNAYVIIAGDLNADKWRKEFQQEKMFRLFEEFGYLNLLESLPSGKRGTHPSKRHGDSALDYIMTKGFFSVGETYILPNNGISDHNALFSLITPNPAVKTDTRKRRRKK